MYAGLRGFDLTASVRCFQKIHGFGVKTKGRRGKFLIPPDPHPPTKKSGTQLQGGPKG